MYAERLPAVPQGNPRNLPSLKPMPSDLAAKPPAPQPSSSSSSSSSVLVERFKALLKQRDEEFRVSPDDDGPPPPPSTEEIVDIYRVVLSELVMNSKPIITELTIIAGDHLEHAEGIADAICSRIIEVPAEQKLPALYLLDSIVKNIGPEYVAHFAPRLHEVFCSAYRQVDPSLYVALDRLFRTWSTVFPHSVLHKIGTELQSLRISHGIHVNPNKVRLLEHTAADTAGGATRLRTAENIIRSSYPPGVNKLHSSSNAALTRPLSPLRQGADTSFSSEIDEYAAESILRRFDRASPAHPASEYGLARVVARDEQASDWRRNQLFSDGRKRLGTPMLNVTNGREHVNPRALIDAYGDDKRKHTSMNKTNQIGSLDIRGKAAPVSWQDTEEQEFNWEDMNPTLADSNRSNNILQASVQPFGGSRLMAVSGKRGFARETDIINKSSGQHPVPARDDSFIYGGDASMISEPGSMEVMPVLQSETYQVPGSPYSVKPMKLVSHTSHMILDKGRVANFQATTSAGGITTDDEKLAPPYRKLPVTTQIRRSAPPRMDSSTFESTYATNIPTSVGMWPLNNVHKSNSLPVQPVLPLQKQSRSSFISSNSIANQGPNPPLLMADQKFDTLDSKELVSARLAVNQHGGIMASKHQSKTPNTPFQPPFLPSREAREKIPPYSAVMGSSHLASSSFNYGLMGQGRGPVISSSQTNSLPMAQPSLSIQNIPNNLMHFQGGSLPPLPPGPPPIPSQTLPISQSPATGLPNNLGGSAYSGLISNLVAQGLISLTNQAPGQDPVGVDFNMDLLKVRHESAVRALYDDLPRQCTTCGLRFKSQEEHSSHMDWHVTKNRMSKNRKQKPSRKWFVSESMWLSGAEALGSEAVPGFLPAETTEEKKSDEEMAVPADEDQNACALCGEPFDDFYSDETEEWMYKGAVYMNAPDGSAAGMDRSQLGPIVHAKCRSESNEVSPGIFPRDEGGSAEESSQRKRLRS